MEYDLSGNTFITVSSIFENFALFASKFFFVSICLNQKGNFLMQFCIID